MQTTYINLTKLLTNEGQLPDLPANPRTINDIHFNKLKQSIIEDPEMLELRELLVYPYNDNYIVICGNMRLQAMRELEVTEAPCKIINIDTPIEKLKAYLIKDNVSGGEWDYELLANQWEVDELISWGLDLPVDFGTIENETNIADINVRDNFSEKQNFIVECECLEDFAELQHKLKINTQKITYYQLKKYLKE